MKNNTYIYLKKLAAGLLSLLLCLTLLPAGFGANCEVFADSTGTAQDQYSQSELTSDADLAYTDAREDYPELSDAEFANFRAINTTGMKADTLYRTSSPIDPAHNRSTYADKALRRANVKVVMNLADTADEVRNYEGYSKTYYSRTKYIALNMGTDYTTADFRSKLAEGLRFFAENNVKAYAIHSTEGKDRTGIVAALLECYTGATYDEVCADYMKSFTNYYKIQPGTAQYDMLLQSGIVTTLQNMFGVSDLSKADLKAEATEYFKEIGLSDSELDALTTNLAETPAPAEDKEINGVDLLNICTTLDPVNKIPFTAELDPKSNEKVRITGESWIGVKSGTIKSENGSGVPVSGDEYTYEITLEAKDGWVFPTIPTERNFVLTVDGAVRTHGIHGDGLKVLVLPGEHKIARITNAVDPVTVKSIDISDASETGIKDKGYTGKVITVTPQIKVNVNGTDYTLKEKDYDLTINPESPKARGTYTVTVTGKDAFTGSITKTFKIVKGKNPIKVKAKAVKVSSSKLKKKAQKVAAKKAMTISKAQGKLSYKKVSGSKKISINKKTGKITVKKGLKKGTYKVKVKVTAKGNKNYKSGSKTVTLKIKVK